eukprot:CAMPEP_0196133750 /NCGR_PEP_ID=MMETSP0910-20130528/2839_1 /TAXON_ID=49265 /ORGANISM="Thalassiosira rotula, Strain GSO102" /LENGTH=151 /DNA_ID=CAMNT_0041393501 /DNA_START=15 /DNA_END=467 /DNA_ORIENTATION=+
MSLASILLRSRLPSAIASNPLLASSWTKILPQRAAVAAASATSAGLNGRLSSSPQIRNSGVMIEVIRQVPSDDPNKAGQLTFEDPDLADARMKRQNRAEAPLRRKPNFSRHEKGWQRRKRLKMEKRYLRLKEGVDELKNYIQFKQDNKPEW